VDVLCAKCGGEEYIHDLWVNLKETYHLEVVDLQKDTIEQILKNLRNGSVGTVFVFWEHGTDLLCGENLD
jgi:lauroyl/myristoyl acyltransferase